MSTHHPTTDRSPRPDDSSDQLVFDAIGFLAWLLLSFSAAFGTLFIERGEWYEQLAKPSWNPPAWLFGPVWTLLYVLMAVAAWQVWVRGGWRRQWLPLSLFLIQWALNAAWTPIFFGEHSLGGALVDVIVLWFVLALTTWLFFRVSKLAGSLLIPYLLWVTFAAVLNYEIWRLNSGG